MPDIARSKIVLLLIIGGLAFSGYALYASRRPSTPTQPGVLPTGEINLQQISNKHFLNQEVVLDGKSFVNCTFENVKFVYSGNPTQIVNYKAVGKMAFETSHPRISNALRVLEMMGLVDPKGFRIRDGTTSVGGD